jgi:hypothetical protein
MLLQYCTRMLVDLYLTDALPAGKIKPEIHTADT